MSAINEERQYTGRTFPIQSATEMGREMTSVDREAIGDEIRAILRAHRRFPEGAVYHLGELAARLGSTRPLEEIPEWEEPREPRPVPR